MKRGNTWMVILAGTEEGRGQGMQDRLAGESAAIAGALRVADDLVSAARTVVVVETDRAAAARLPATVPPDSLVVLPSRRGTGVYLLMALFSILPHDPRARIVVLNLAEDRTPEELLLPAIQEALLALSRLPERLVLVGCRPAAADAPDAPDRGWIIPSCAPPTPHGCPVAAFVEKPDYRMARHLLGGGALLNSGIFAVKARTLLELYAALTPRLVREFVCLQGESTASNLAAHLQTITCCDFNSEVLEWAHGSLAVVPLPERAGRRLRAPDTHAPALGVLSPRHRKDDPPALGP